MVAVEKWTIVLMVAVLHSSAFMSDQPGHAVVGRHVALDRLIYSYRTHSQEP
jgi:hypothetical protein